MPVWLVLDEAVDERVGFEVDELTEVRVREKEAVPDAVFVEETVND